MIIAEAEELIQRDPAAAASMAREALAVNSSDAAAYRLLGASLRRLGLSEEANRAELSAIQASATDRDLIRARQALIARDLRTSEMILRGILEARPNDVVAIQMLGEIAATAGLLQDAEALHRRALSLAPGFEYARLHLANILNSQGRPGESLAELREIQGEILQFEGFKMLMADTLSHIGEIDEAIPIYRDVLAFNPDKPLAWSRLVFLLNSVGRRDEAVETCRSALRVPRASASAWWSLADLKTYRFTDEDVEALERTVVDPSLRDDDRASCHFALGKVFEDRHDFRTSFEHYRRGNALRKGRLKYSPKWGDALLERVRDVFTSEFFESRAGQGDPAPDPIFIIGMPRAGSTLVEQILASHPSIEGTAELPDINALALSLQPEPRHGPGSVQYLDRLKDLTDERLRELGSLYIERTRIQRRTARPFFIDKMPSNWVHAGFIKLILPNAKIIDVRRHPLACGFSNFKQLFGVGHEFSYDLAHIGAYYKHYVDVMAHYDAVSPGMVRRLIHEQLIADPEGEIRRLLDFVGLPFDEACLRFHKTERSVRTPSSQQVREPLRSDVATQWKAFEDQLSPLKDALGSTLEHWDDPQ